MKKTFLLVFPLVFCALLSFPSWGTQIPAKERFKRYVLKIEASGLLETVPQGAFEPDLWKGQKRSEISSQISMLPGKQMFPAVQSMQRRLLLSAFDISGVVNDVPLGLKSGKDLFTVRLSKLMDMGLYDDALALYLKSVKKPYSEKLARIGVLLKIYSKDMSTACLDEKVLYSRFREVQFWKQLHKICAIQLGDIERSEVVFEKSDVLNSIYHRTSYSVPYYDVKTLGDMTHLERAVLFVEGRVDYKSDSNMSIPFLPARLLPLFLEDPNLPTEIRALIAGDAVSLGIAPLSVVTEDDEVYKAVEKEGKPLKKWKMLENIVMSGAGKERLGAYSGMLLDVDSANIPQEVLMEVVRVLLWNYGKLTPFWCGKIEEGASEYPQNYVYLQSLEISGACEGGPPVSKDLYEEGMRYVKRANAEKINKINRTLDKSGYFTDNPDKAYEKHSSKESGDSYKMASGDFVRRMFEARSAGETGMLVLTVLDAFRSETPRSIDPDILEEALGSLMSVGLVEDAGLIANQVIAGIVD